MVEGSATSGQQWLRDWFERRGVAVDGVTPSLNYLETGWVDSFGLMQLILDIEAALGTEVPGDKLHEPDFQTIGGLAAVIDELRAAR